MSFSSKLKESILPTYTKNIADDFFKPILAEAKLYRRVSAYFTSAGVDLYIEGIEGLARNGGEVRFVISKEISEDDYNSIIKGYDLLRELEPLKISQRNEILTPKMQEKLGNLAYMIAIGKAKVKIALSHTGDFHDKFGIISTDSEDVFFNGSMNETKNGIMTNYESISVDVSWDNSPNVKSRMKENSDRFNRLWSNSEPGITVLEASDIAYNEIAQYQPLSNIKDIPPEVDDCNYNELLEDTITFIYYEKKVYRIDKSNVELTKTDRLLKYGSDISRFFESDNIQVKPGTVYTDIETIIKVTSKRAKRRNIDVVVSKAVEDFLSRNKYSIEYYRILGNVYKGKIEKFPYTKKKEYENFSQIVQSEVERPLYELHLRAAFYEYQMSKSANFSVPGSGKTAMMLGVFAYLNSKKIRNKDEKIERILVVSPISAFQSWKDEFKEVFGKKKKLRVIDSQTSKNFDEDLRLTWKMNNLILINYESLPKYENILIENIDSQTMLVFDEVHRVKNPSGIRAESALSISEEARFKYVLSGTPIPNSYVDIYNFLNILYKNEYNSYFGWTPTYLKEPRVRQIHDINSKLYPFFWRTNKDDLEVPHAETDIIISVPPSDNQQKLAEYIYYKEKSSLAKLIRLIQASTNPSLIGNTINYNEIMSYDEENDLSSITEKEFNNLLGVNDSPIAYDYAEFELDTIISPKFIKGIELVCKLVSESKKVVVWGIFVDTLVKITNELKERGILVNLVYGGTDKWKRVELINDFKDGDIEVLVTNPQTLGEAISLHKTVHDAVYFEYNFNLTFMLQSRDRIHRLGLSRDTKTRYYYLQTEDESWDSYRPGYIDQKIYQRLKNKEEIMYNAIDNKTLSIEYNKDEILEAIEIIEQERSRIYRK